MRERKVESSLELVAIDVIMSVSPVTQGHSMELGDTYRKTPVCKEDTQTTGNSQTWMDLHMSVVA